MKKYSIFRYGIMKRLKRGKHILIFLGFKCSLDCEYCSLKYVSGKYPKSNIIGIEEWKRIIKSFPTKLKEIKLTGGEPMLYPNFVELVNWLLDEGYFVMVLTNFTKKVTGIKQSRKLLFVTTHHQGVDVQRWERNLKFYKKNYRVKVEEIQYRAIKESKVKDLCYREDLESCCGFIYSPEGYLYTSTRIMLEDHVWY